MIQITTLEAICTGDIHEVFTEAFSDYAEPWHKSLRELEHMLARRGYRPDLSFGAFVNNKPVSFVLNGAGLWQGRWTVYDTGTGTVKAYRRRGLVQQIFREALPLLKQKGIEQYLLEVIKVNTKAYSLYEKEGFGVTRELDYYISARDRLYIRPGKINRSFIVKEMRAPDWELLKTFWDFEPSWQNSTDSMLRRPGAFTVLGIYRVLEPVGYIVIEPATGDIPQLAVASRYRRMGLATTLLREAAGRTETGAIKFINADAAYKPFRALMKSFGIAPGHGQYEMMRTL